MEVKTYDVPHGENTWCPGCGNFPILTALKQALAVLDVEPSNLIMVSGIGQAAKLPHFVNSHFFNGLHGRALPAATAIKAALPDMTVVVVGGDGDLYAEGGNHLSHAVRRNPNLTLLAHNNMVYGLTKGQASPTSRRGYRTPIQINGVSGEPFNPIATAIALDCSFVARASAADLPGMKEILTKAIAHRGFSFVDIFQPCVSFNKINTYAWFKERTYYLNGAHDPCDKVEAFRRSLEEEKFPLGVFYVKEGKPTFEETLPAHRGSREPLWKRPVPEEKIQKLLDNKI